MSPFLFRIVDKLLILLKECGYQARPFANDLAVWGGRVEVQGVKTKSKNGLGTMDSL